ncbi:hypothetical protein [Phenylobacterium montanum]|uniref:Uncharacterized protein n=1 Tax=Phenylobacterium montanum TaxID=2823693 RepID=A0A975IW72_9CAUL|nr:hypothetical protein [Caulobacter sp. S6]QUD89520.1 hypothetical protein KCG34_06460 [Caulobacter sp. S6]
MLRLEGEVRLDGVLGLSMRIGLAGVAALFEANALAASPSPPAPMLQFDGARLGMTLDQWKALPFPGVAPANLLRVCTPDLASSRAAAAGPSRQVECSYATRYGPETLVQSFPLTKRFLARAPHYFFSQNRLVKIEFRTSVDAFDDVVAQFQKQYGAASRTSRDDVRAGDGLALPRVRVLWRLRKGTVEVTDPSSVPNLLEVSLAGA